MQIASNLKTFLLLIPVVIHVLHIIVVLNVINEFFHVFHVKLCRKLNEILWNQTLDFERFLG